HYWSRSTCCSNIKCFTYNSWKVSNIIHLVIIFGDRCRYPKNIRFLKGICTYYLTCHLTCKNNKWQRIHHRICNTCNQIGCTRSISRNYTTRLPSYTCITLRRKNSSLFISRQYLPTTSLPTMQGTITWQYSASRVTNNCITAFFHQQLNKQITSSHRHRLCL